VSGGTVCPVCGAANDCGVAAGKVDCWCFTAVLPPEVLEKIPGDAQGSVCVCPACARQSPRIPAAEESEG